MEHVTTSFSIAMSHPVSFALDCPNVFFAMTASPMFLAWSPGDLSLLAVLEMRRSAPGGNRKFSLFEL
jgi:hypothetical protein